MEKSISVAEMRILRLNMCGMTRKDRISNEYIIGNVRFTSISGEMK